jgi:hypothetical protein
MVQRVLTRRNSAGLSSQMRHQSLRQQCRCYENSLYDNRVLMSGSVDYMRGFRLKLVRHYVAKAQALTASHVMGKYI